MRLELDGVMGRYRVTRIFELALLNRSWNLFWKKEEIKCDKRVEDQENEQKSGRSRKLANEWQIKKTCKRVADQEN